MPNFGRVWTGKNAISSKIAKQMAISAQAAIGLRRVMTWRTYMINNFLTLEHAIFKPSYLLKAIVNFNFRRQF